MKLRYDGKHKPWASRKGDQVYLRLKTHNVPGVANRGLTAPRCGPFIVEKMVGSLAAIPKLPENWKIHPVISTRKLSRTYPTTKKIRIIDRVDARQELRWRMRRRKWRKSFRRAYDGGGALEKRYLSTSCDGKDRVQQTICGYDWKMYQHICSGSTSKPILRRKIKPILRRK